MNRIFARIVLAAALFAPALALTPDADAGRVGGRGHDFTTVDAYSVNTYHIRFRGGELASILIDGDGDTDLDLFIYDRYGNLVASDTDGTDTCLGTFVPDRTSTYRVEIHNLGDVYNRYSLETN